MGARPFARAMVAVATLAAAAIAASAACSSFDAEETVGDAGIDAAPAPDSSADGSSPDGGGVLGDAAPEASCDLDAAWGPAVQIVAAAGGGDTHATLTEDELTIFFDRLVLVPSSREAIFTAQRAKIGDTFDGASEVSFNGTTDTLDPALAPDGLSLFFSSNRSVQPDFDLWVVTRPSITSAFNVPSRLSPSSTSLDRTPSVAPNGDLWFASDRGGDLDIYEAARIGTDGGYAIPATVQPLSSPASDGMPVHSRDGATVLFASDRAGNGSMADIWISTRPTPGAPLKVPTPVSELNSPNSDLPLWLSPDSCRLYLSSDRSGIFRIYVSSRAK